MASTAALSAAAQDRKARLAQLKSLKRKQEEAQEDDGSDQHPPRPGSPRYEDAGDDSTNVTRYLSGRNYDFETKGAKLGFETSPSEGKDTLERKAAALAEETRRQAAEEENADKPLDLFKLQPKKPNWDLKRDLDRKLEVLNVRTDNAVAHLVRDRIAKQQEAARAQVNGTAKGGPKEEAGDGEAAGIEGATLVEATHVREREDEEDVRREREEEDALLDGT